jgi:hypothetical protein
MRAPSLTVGLVVAAALAGSYPVLVAAVSERHDLLVEHRSPDPYEVRASSSARKAHPELLPEAVLARAEETTYPHGGGPGMFLRTWSASYGDRWQREVTLPSLVGPFVPEGEEVCGYDLWLGAGLFDTDGAGAGLKWALDKRLKRQFPFDEPVEELDMLLHFAAIRRTDLHVVLSDGEVWLLADITLDDGVERAKKKLDQPTRFTASVPVRLRSFEGAPQLARAGAVRVTWQGHSREVLIRAARKEGFEWGALLGALVLGYGAIPGALIGEKWSESKANDKVRLRAERRVTQQLDETLRNMTLSLNAFREPWRPLAGRPGSAVLLRLHDSSVTRRGIGLSLCATSTVAEADAARVPGVTPLRENAEPAPTHAEDRAPKVVVTLTGTALNQVLRFLWQSGALRDWGSSSVLLDQLPAGLENLAFDVTGFDPGLPPVVMPTALRGSLLAMLGNVRLGSWDERTVVGHAATRLSVSTLNDEIKLNGKVERLAVNCFEQVTSKRVQLTPCLSELLPLARDAVEEREVGYAVRGADLLGKLPQLAFQGVQVLPSNLSVATSTEPVGLTVSVDVALRATP